MTSRSAARHAAAIIGAALLAAGMTSHAAEPVAPQTGSPPKDSRQLVRMPAEAERLLRQDMLEHLATLNQLLGQVAASEFQQASALAESRLGNSSMGKHRGTGMGPGRFMPPAMHQLGMAMHQAATDFSTTAATGDSAETLAALQRITSFCVACHAGFRIR
jgi:hypothetical protein